MPCYPPPATPHRPHIYLAPAPLHTQFHHIIKQRSVEDGIVLASKVPQIDGKEAKVSGEVAGITSSLDQMGTLLQAASTKIGVLEAQSGTDSPVYRSKIGCLRQQCPGSQTSFASFRNRLQLGLLLTPAANMLCPSLQRQRWYVLPKRHNIPLFAHICSRTLAGCPLTPHQTIKVRTLLLCVLGMNAFICKLCSRAHTLIYAILYLVALPVPSCEPIACSPRALQPVLVPVPVPTAVSGNTSTWMRCS